MDWFYTLAFVMVGLGLVLMVSEFFMPTGGFFVLGGLTLWALAVGLIVYYGDTTEAAAAIISLCVGVPIVWNVGLYGYRKFYATGLTSETTLATLANDPEIAELESLKGRHGKTVTPMRPSGTVEIDNRRIDAMSEGMMLEAGMWIRCVEVRAGKVIVRRADEPVVRDNASFENLDLSQ